MLLILCGEPDLQIQSFCAESDGSISVAARLALTLCGTDARLTLASETP